MSFYNKSTLTIKLSSQHPQLSSGYRIVLEIIILPIKPGQWDWSLEFIFFLCPMNPCDFWKAN